VSDSELSIRFSGERSDDPAVVGEVLTAWGGLLRAVSAEVCGDENAVEWRLGGVRWVCDGCGAERPERPDDWRRHKGLDWCPACEVPS